MLLIMPKLNANLFSVPPYRGDTKHKVYFANSADNILNSIVLKNLKYAMMVAVF